MHRHASMRAACILLLALSACRPKPVEPDPAPAPPPPEVPTAQAQMPAAASVEPELGAMKLATASSKLGVPVDLRYQFDGEVEPGRPVTLHLAAVPRVTGNNLRVSIKQEPGIEAITGAMMVAKANATAAYRQQLSVMRKAAGPRELRVLVTMDMPEGSAFGYYSVPLEPVAPAAKRERSEQR